MYIVAPMLITRLYTRVYSGREYVFCVCAFPAVFLLTKQIPFVLLVSDFDCVSVSLLLYFCVFIAPVFKISCTYSVVRSVRCCK